MAGNGSASGTSSTSLKTSHVATAASDKLTVTGSIIDAEPELFAHFLSTVNVVRWQHMAGLPSSTNHIGSKSLSLRAQPKTEPMSLSTELSRRGFQGIFRCQRR